MTTKRITLELPVDPYRSAPTILVTHELLRRLQRVLNSIGSMPYTPHKYATWKDVYELRGALEALIGRP